MIVAPASSPRLRLRAAVNRRSSSRLHVRARASNDSDAAAASTGDSGESAPTTQCEAVGCSPELRKFCDGKGRIKGGMGALVDWWPIKVYRPCPAAAEAGRVYVLRTRGRRTDHHALAVLTYTHYPKHTRTEPLKHVGIRRRARRLTKFCLATRARSNYYDQYIQQKAIPLQDAIPLTIDVEYPLLSLTLTLTLIEMYPFRLRALFFHPAHLS